MALFFPSLSSCRFDTPAEKRLAERLIQKLEDDYLCWFNVPVGSKALQPDFMILHPQRGLLVLETKDWKLDNIISLRKDHGEMHNRENDYFSIRNPLNQARIYALEATVTLQKDPLLCQTKAPHKGKLVMPYGWGVVLTNITRKQFDSASLADVLDANRVICQDEMYESVDAEAFQQRLWDMFYQSFPCNLSPQQIDRVRWHLYPEVRLNTESSQFGLFTHEQAPAPTILRVMDLQQEQLARSLGTGHRVIHGVAGSGKTMILGYRSTYLAKFVTKPILILCFNKALASRLAQVINAQESKVPVEVLHFHGWCDQLLKQNNIDVVKGSDEYFDRLVLTCNQAIEDGRIAKQQYAAILLDEGHDFKPQWLQMVVPMLAPETNALLVLYDDAQSIYGKKNLDFTFSSVNIQAQGRTTILKLNYRNTLEILAVAKEFGKGVLHDTQSSDDGIPTIAPESAGRRGKLPKLLSFNSSAEEWLNIAQLVQHEIDQGIGLNDIAIIVAQNRHIEQAEAALSQLAISFKSSLNSKSRHHLFEGEPSIKIVTMHSSKGLEFHTVFIPCINDLAYKEERFEDDMRLLYVAMTRAMDHLVLSHHKDSDFVQRTQRAITQVTLQLHDL